MICTAGYGTGEMTYGVRRFQRCQNEAVASRCMQVSEFCVVTFSLCRPHALLVDSESQEHALELVHNVSGAQ